ncbi:MAG: aconitase X catalytic domain-containing protein [Woeseiaceae bacterium]|nr:aconitase X catalytic domain-containing protein [Woeseiaceae bacterium]
MLRLNSADREMLSGNCGEAAQFAMRMLFDIGEAFGADEFVDIEWAHVAGAYCQTRANVDFAAQLTRWNARVAVPTTLTACSLDMQSPSLQDSSARDLVRAYEAMGCEPVLSCSPYHTRDEPGPGAHVAWCESSAVVFANSVLGARTNCYPEFMDMCAAITGRVPRFGMHADENRKATLRIDVRDIPLQWFDDAWLFQSLGILVGKQAGRQVPVITGLPRSTKLEQLRALGSAAASAGSLLMFHVPELTPEAPSLDAATHGEAVNATFVIEAADIRAAAAALCSNTTEPVAAVCVGAPHFSTEEFGELARLFDGRRSQLPFIAATSGAVLTRLDRSGLLVSLQESGVRFVTGRCTYYRPAVDGVGGHVMTNSAKWAWYAPAGLGVAVTFASLEDCVARAVDG